MVHEIVKYRGARGKNNTDEIGQFFHDARWSFEKDGIVELILEPGDMTRYRFILVKLMDHSVVLTCLMGRSWAAQMGEFTTNPGYIQEKSGSEQINICTLSVASQIVNTILCPGSRLAYYDWNSGCPIL